MQMSIIIGSTSYTDGTAAPIQPVANAGAAGANYLVCLSPTDATGMARVVFTFNIHGYAAGLLPDLRTANLVVIHYFTSNSVGSPLDASAVGVFNGTDADLLPNRVGTGNYTYMSTVQVPVNAVKSGFVQAAEGAAIEGDIQVEVPVFNNNVACLGSLMPSSRRHVAAVVIARDYLGSLPLQPLFLDWSCAGTSVA